ncbi:MAG: 2,3-bisphosphoglycerate-independent phosphoglycerate mutase [Clostridiales Family XIII bacterium]|jgi:2,3-bisphosphoglycerate-independent phosphoglycerate mutase|nr:2,3-bisphosphoglycerate-independent phosphoglycerate mutase [Clostridiales Family XIII bacterium]
MKYLIVVPDGAADRPYGPFGENTPLELADMPYTDGLARRGIVGQVQTIPLGVKPGSDAANLAVIGYDPAKDLTGRSPLEAVSMGVGMSNTDVSFRANLVTLMTADGGTPSAGDAFEDLVIIDHSAGDISSEEGGALIEYLDDAIGSGDPANEDRARFYPGISYRHALIVRDGEMTRSGIGDVVSEAPGYDLTPPHDVLDMKIGPNLPSGDGSGFILNMMKESFDLLAGHPVNAARREAGLRTADAIWIWGQGRHPKLTPIAEKYGVSGTVVAAVDLIKGIGICAGLEAPEVKGATGTIDTDFGAKANVATDAYEAGSDFVFIHVEAPDECSHQGDADGKVRSLGLIDAEVIAPVVDWLEANRGKTGEGYRVLIVPDHRTPLSLRTHSSESVPFVYFDSGAPAGDDGAGRAFTERSGKTGIRFDSGVELADSFFGAGIEV